MDLTNQQIKDTYGNVLTIGTTAGSPTTGTLQNGEGLNITSFTFGSYGSIVGTGGYQLNIYGGGQSWLPNLGIIANLGFGPAFSSDTFLTRDGGSGLLAQRNSTNAQTFNIYNTYTDGSNYERGFLKWDSNVLKIGTEALGTGTVREVAIVLPNGQQVAFGSTAVRIPAGCNLNRVSGNQQIGISAAPWERIFVYESNLVEKSADPSDPAEGQSVMWQSDGTGTGDDGDILIKITAGGTTKTATLVDFSTI